MGVPIKEERYQLIKKLRHQGDWIQLQYHTSFYVEIKLFSITKPT